jgi:ABC-2 type transport system permease protein
MSRLRSIWLVARREIIERGRSRAYVLSLVVTIVLIGAGILLPALVSGGPKVLRVGVIGEGPPGLQQAIEAVAHAFDPDAKVEFGTLSDRGAAESLLGGDSIDVALAVPSDLSGPGEIIVQESLDGQDRAVISQAIIGLRAGEALTPPEVTELDPRSAEDQTAFLFANAGIILMFVGIFTYGYWVLGGVVEEKQSRVVEVVLSTVRARDLLIGKVLGIGVLGLAQLIVIVVVGLVVSQVSGRLALPPTTFGAIAMLLLWFVLGYALYSTALGFLGALASRMEEASNATTPVTMLAVFSYLAAILLVTEDPSSLFARVLTLLPPSAPMVVPLRAALGAIEPWEIVLSVGITAAAIWGLFVIGGRVYSGAVLQTGGRIKLRDAWRASSR